MKCAYIVSAILGLAPRFMSEAIAVTWLFLESDDIWYQKPY